MVRKLAARKCSTIFDLAGLDRLLDFPYRLRCSVACASVHRVRCCERSVGGFLAYFFFCRRSHQGYSQQLYMLQLRGWICSMSSTDLSVLPPFGRSRTCSLDPRAVLWLEQIGSCDSLSLSLCFFLLPLKHTLVAYLQGSPATRLPKTLLPSRQRFTFWVIARGLRGRAKS